MTTFQLIRNFAIIFIYILLFGTAAFDKWKSLTTPEWFIKQFEKTFISQLPGGAKFGYWLIASLEAILALAFVVSIFNFVILPFALLGSLFLFGILLFGLRITYDFQGSANMFIYFGTTLLSLFLVTMS
jgi:hypothetical protein